MGEKIEPFSRFMLRCEVCRIVRNAASWSSILNELLPYGTIWQKIYRIKCQVSCHYDRTLFLDTGRRHNESCPISNVNQLDMTNNPMSQLVNIFKCAVQHTGHGPKF